MLDSMARVTIYVPEKLAKTARQRARRAKKSMSAWIAELLERELTPRGWSQDFIDLLTKGAKGDIVVPDDPPIGDLDDDEKWP
jgi:hypothetical protein